MGRKANDPEVDHDKSLVAYGVTAASNGDAEVTMGDKKYAPPEISAMILQKLKADAEGYLGETGQRGRDHGPGPLQRQPASGNQGRGGGSPVSRCSASSTSQPRRPSPMASTRRPKRRLPSTIWVVVPSTSRSSQLATGSSRSKPPTATPTSAATISTSASSFGLPTNSRRSKASTCARIGLHYSV